MGLDTGKKSPSVKNLPVQYIHSRVCQSMHSSNALSYPMLLAAECWWVARGRLFVFSLAEKVFFPRVFQAERSSGNAEVTDSVGRWGEEFVYEYLRSTLRSEIEGGSCRVHWLNDEEEQGKPYDLLLTVSLLLYVHCNPSSEEYLCHVHSTRRISPGCQRREGDSSFFLKKEEARQSVVGAFHF